MDRARGLYALVAATFEAQEGKTKLTLKHEGLPPGEDLDNCRIGWSQSFDNLADVLAKR